MASSLAGRPPAAARNLVGCPTDDQLLAFIPGELAPETEASVSAHLESCPTCQSRLTTLRHRSRTEKAVEPTSPPAAALPSPALPAKDTDAPTMPMPQQRARMPSRIGQYQLLKQIGRGGMGLVYLARHVRLGRTVALKLLPGLHLSDESAVVRLQREIAAAGRLQHPNIVFATDANEDHGIDYLVMEHIEGIDVGRLVAAVGPLPCPAACEIVRQAALGLAHIHSCNLVHRDLKPSNLMLASDGVVKILDLGLARLREGLTESEESATQSGYLLGTADYVSPEQLHSPHDADVRSDLYSLGCTFYKLLTGRPPFSGSEHSSLAKKFDAHRYAAHTPIREQRPEAAPEIDEILAKLLAKDPRDRLQEPVELAALLAPLATGADLRALYEQVGPQADLDDPRLPTPSQTPQPANASTHPQGRTPTPMAIALPRRRRLALMIGAGLITTAIAAAVGVYGASAGLRRPRELPAAPPVAAAPTPGGRWHPLVLPFTNETERDVFMVDPKLDRITCVPDHVELLQLGTLHPGTGMIRAEIELPQHMCDGGFFFGYHRNDSPDGAQAETLLVFLQPPNRSGEKRPARLYHGQYYFRPADDYVNRATRMEQIEDKPIRKYRLEISYTPEGIQAIRVDGHAFPAILQSQIKGQQIDPQRLWGTWGIFANRGTVIVSQLDLQPES